MKVSCDPRNLAAVECQTQADSCTEDQFHCGSGECVDIGQLCDGAEETPRTQCRPLSPDLVLGAQIAASASLEEWKSQPAQQEVDLADLVPAVRAILARTGG